MEAAGCSKGMLISCLKPRPRVAHVHSIPMINPPTPGPRLCRYSLRRWAIQGWDHYIHQSRLWIERDFVDCRLSMCPVSTWNLEAMVSHIPIICPWNVDYRVTTRGQDTFAWIFLQDDSTICPWPGSVLRCSITDAIVLASSIVDGVGVMIVWLSVHNKTALSKVCKARNVAKCPRL